MATAKVSQAFGSPEPRESTNQVTPPPANSTSTTARHHDESNVDGSTARFSPRFHATR